MPVNNPRPGLDPDPRLQRLRHVNDRPLWNKGRELAQCQDIGPGDDVLRPILDGGIVSLALAQNRNGINSISPFG